MLVCSVIQYSSIVRLLLRQQLTIGTANWIAQAFLVKGDGHPLAEHIPKARYRSFAINSLNSRWVITFSRRSNPVYLAVKGHDVEIASIDAGSLTVTLEELSVLAMASNVLT